MKLQIFLLTSLIHLQVAAGLPYALTLGNVTVSYDISALRNGFHVEITALGDGQLPSFQHPFGSGWQFTHPGVSTLTPVLA